MVFAVDVVAVGTRRAEALPDGGYARSFVPVGDVFGGLVIPVVDSAVDTLVIVRRGARPASERNGCGAYSTR